MLGEVSVQMPADRPAILIAMNDRRGRQRLGGPNRQRQNKSKHNGDGDGQSNN